MGDFGAIGKISAEALNIFKNRSKSAQKAQKRRISFNGVPRNAWASSEHSEWSPNRQNCSTSFKIAERDCNWIHQTLKVKAIMAQSRSKSMRIASGTPRGGLKKRLETPTKYGKHFKHVEQLAFSTEIVEFDCYWGVRQTAPYLCDIAT